MSTKSSIKWRNQTKEHPGFHLYDDALGDFTAQDGSVKTPVYLQLDGVSVQLETLSSGGASVTVALPRDVAQELGLLPPSNGASDSTR